MTPYNPSVLVTRKGLSIFDQMRLDDQIKAAMTFKKSSILSTGWEVVSPEGQSEEWEPTRCVDAALRDIEGTLDDDLWEILSALDYGYSVTEKIWETVEDGDFAGKLHITALKTRKPHSFSFDVDAFGNLKPNGILQYQVGGAPKPLPADKFVLFQHESEFQNPYGRSDLEAAFRPWWSKDNTLKWLIMFLERLGFPPIFGMYDPAKYNSAQIDQLKKIFENLQAATFGIIPRHEKDSFDVWSGEGIGSSRVAQTFIPALESFDKAIARSLLMPGHLGLTTDQQQGSFARAKVNFDVFMLVIERLRKDLEQRVMMEQVVKPMVDANYTVEEYPQWRFLPLTDDVRVDILQQWQTLVGARVVIPQAEDEIHVRQMLQFPAKDPSAPEAGPLPDPVLPTNGQKPNGDKPVEEKPKPKDYAQYDRRVDYAKISGSLDRLEAQTAEQLKPLFLSVRDRFLKDAEKSLDSIKATGQVDLKGFGDVQNALREFLRQAYGIGDATLRAELQGAALVFPVSVYQFAPTEALRWLSQKALTISGILRDRLLAEAKLILLNALKFGEVAGETMGKLRQLFSPYVGDPTLIVDEKVVEAYRLETILRTVSTEAFNTGRLTAANDPDIRGDLRGMVYSAVIDDRTTSVCRLLDGKVIPMDEPALDRLAPPNHFSCRSILVPVTLDMLVDQKDVITPSEIGRAEELTPKGFK